MPRAPAPAGPREPPAGLIVHTAGFGGAVFRIFDVWESEEHRACFNCERLMPIIEQLMSEGALGGPPSRDYTYELYDAVRG